jgi:hypothetical protein
MNWDFEKIDEAVLALLYLNLHDGIRAWKSFDWDALDRLHNKGLIDNPVSKNKSIVLTPKGLEVAASMAKRNFSRPAEDNWQPLPSRPGT